MWRALLSKTYLTSNLDCSRMDADRSNRNCKPTPRQIAVWEHRLVWFLMLAVAAMWGYLFIIGRVDRHIKSGALTLLQERFPDHVISLGRTHLESGKALLIENLRISVRDGDHVREVFYVQQIVAHGPIELIELARGQTDIRSVTVRGLQASAWLLEDGRWSLETLASSSSPLPTIPPVSIRSGILRLLDKDPQQPGLVLHDLDARINPHRTAGSSQVTGYQVTASVASGYFERCGVSGWLSSDKSSWQLSGEIEECLIGDNIIERLPETLQSKARGFSGISCQTDMQFQLNQQPNMPLQYVVNGDLRRGRVEHPSLPYLFEGLRGAFRWTPEGVAIERIEARSKGTNLFASARLSDITKLSPFEATLTLQDLELDQQLFSALPEKFRQLWTKLALAGRIDVQATLAFDGFDWVPDLTVTCKHASIESDAFPYRIDNITGLIHYRGKQVWSENLVGRSREQILRGELQMQHVIENGQGGWLYNMAVSTDRSIPIDEKLLSALTPRGKPTSKAETFARSLNPTGRVFIQRATFRKTNVSQTKPSKLVEVRFDRGQIQYQNFRYPIFGIEGPIVIDNDFVRIERLTGRNDSARIVCSGSCICGDEGLNNLDLSFVAHDIPLEEELHRAMPLQVRELWNSLQPAGVIDQVNVQLRSQAQSPALKMRVEIEETRTLDDEPIKSVSLRPKVLPYLLSDIACHMVYEDGKLQIVRMAGSHDSSYVLATGVCSINSNGQWDALVRWLPTSRIILDQSLLATLPMSLRKPLLSLDFRGPVNVEGWTQFVSGQDAAPYARSWNVNLEVEDGQLGNGYLASGIRGTIGVEGTYDQLTPRARGMLLIDSLSIQGIPILGLNGAFAVDGDLLYFGREVDQVQLAPLPDPIQRDQFSSASYSVQQASAQLGSKSNKLVGIDSELVNSASSSPNASRVSNPPRNRDVNAKMLGGQLALFGIARFSNSMMNIQAQLSNARLPELLAVAGQPDAGSSGDLTITLNQLQGSLQNFSTLSGSGSVGLRNADLYDLPAMVKLFRLLSINPPDDGVFQSADSQFSIDGDRITLDQLAMDGDLISLTGSGIANFRKELHLDLYAYIGRRGQLAKLLAPVFKQETATFMFIEVDGTLDNLQYRRSIPGFEASLESVFPEKVTSLSPR